jgi:hypothetical protein
MQKKFKYNIGLQFFLVLFILFSSCKKNVQGPKGDQGTAGKDGNSDITYAAIITQPSNAWDTIIDDAITDWESLIIVPEITLNVLKNGTVKVYCNVDDAWWPLPYTYDEVVTQGTFTQNTIKLNVSNMHGETPERPDTQKYRVVIVEKKL